jgi:glycosyl transferase family 2/glycosyl transferase family 87
MSTAGPRPLPAGWEVSWAPGLYLLCGPRGSPSMADGVTLVLAALDEAGNIGAVVDEALAVLPRCAPDFEIVVVDDGSSDGTAAEVEAVARREPRVRCFRHPRTRGYGAAMRTGIGEARLPLVVLCDGDGQLDPADIPALLEPLRRGEADLAAGRRTLRRDRPHRLLFGAGWNGLVRNLFGIAHRDVNGGLKALPRDLALRLDLRAEGGFFSAELLGKAASAGLRVAEVPVRHRPRARGSATGARPGVVLGAFRDLLRFGPSVALFGPPAPWAGRLARFLPAPRPLAWILTLLLAALYGGWTARVVAKDQPVDYYLYLVAAKGLAGGEDVWSLGDADWARLKAATGVPDAAPPYRYPPLPALALRPFLSLPPRTGAAVWIALAAAACIAAAWAVGAALRVRYGIPMALVALGGFSPAMHALFAGQVVPFVLLALCLALLALARERPGAAGVLLAAGFHMKVFPVVHLAWLGGTRRRRALAAGLAALAVLAAVAEAAAPGSWASWLGNLPRLGEAGSLRPEAWNQSLNGFLARVLLPADPSGGAARACVAAGTLAVVGTTAFLCIRAGPAAGTVLLQASLVTAAVVLVSPYSYHYQFLFLLPAGLVLADRALGARPRPGILAALAAGYLAADTFALARRRIEGVPIVESLPFLGAALLWVLLARELRAANA